ncbi:hypothetical protein BUALT_Bualt18G0017400 [Buddleja alternifolia]|uniref:Reverse transcriptase zinc-binding domain-containing protein n=1 Tax=Buddleja alternifolia TaxID=168488 RepID=A0AAV6WCH9_9LAMI|nr:hypothetical protein BUALT_Bualt18G0017400 [Buddleja alternifolia]
MDKEIERFQRSLMLTEEEEVALPSELCTEDFQHNGLVLVGRVLSPRPYNFEAFKYIIVRIIHPLRGLTVRKISDERFVLIFNHEVDMQRALEEGPCHFDKNLIVLASVHINDSPSSMPLNTCRFRFKEADLTANSVSWGSILKMTVDIDVTKPLKRVLRMQTSNGDSYINPGTQMPFGLWLRALLFNSRGQSSISNRDLFSERPLFTTPTQSRSGSPSHLVRRTSGIEGASDTHMEQSHCIMQPPYCATYPFSKTHGCVSPISPSLIGNNTDDLPTTHQGIGDGSTNVDQLAKPSLMPEDRAQSSMVANLGFTKMGRGRPVKKFQNLISPRNSGVQLRIGSKRPSQEFVQESDDPFARNNKQQSGSLVLRDELLVRHIFWAPDVDVILSIPLARYAAEDTLVWHYTKNGLFSVKSAYHVARNLGSTGLGGTSNHSLNWQFIWGAAVPHKVRVFAWHVCRGILPTLSNLQRRKCNVFDVCPCCGMNTETDVHVLLECDLARQIWSLSNLPWDIVARWHGSVEA